MSKLLTRKEAAKLAKVTTRTITKWYRKGWINSPPQLRQYCGRAHRVFDAASIRAFLKNGVER